MRLTAGTRLGAYSIQSALGAGGMGEVYLARDTNLARDVAIKVLPEAFAHDAERLARFEREARTLAALNHPNIAIVHGLESVLIDSGHVRALVMELVDGPTLAELIRKRRGLLQQPRGVPVIVFDETVGKIHGCTPRVAGQQQAARRVEVDAVRRGQPEIARRVSEPAWRHAVCPRECARKRLDGVVARLEARGGDGDAAAESPRGAFQ